MWKVLKQHSLKRATNFFPLATATGRRREKNNCDDHRIASHAGVLDTYRLGERIRNHSLCLFKRRSAVGAKESNLSPATRNRSEPYREGGGGIRLVFAATQRMAFLGSTICKCIHMLPNLELLVRHAMVQERSTLLSIKPCPGIKR